MLSSSISQPSIFLLLCYSRVNLKVLRAVSLPCDVERPGHGRHFEPDQQTTTAVELYLSSLKEQDYSVSHRTREREKEFDKTSPILMGKNFLQQNPSSCKKQILLEF